MSPAYKVKFDFKPTRFESDWTNIIHLTTDHNVGEYGERIPGVWFHDGSSATATENKLHICSAVNGEGSFCVNSSPVPRGQWTTVEISQQKEGSSYKYTIKINGATLKAITNKQPKEFSKVKVYGADPWYNAAQGVIRNLIVTSVVIYGMNIGSIF